jgi:hypothetical protein
MTLTIQVLLLVVAIVCFVLVALNVLPEINLLAIGLAFLAAGHLPWPTSNKT